MKMKHTITMPDGKDATRTSETKTYTHGVCVKAKNPEATWWVMNWAGSEALALKKATAAVALDYEIKILPCRQEVV